MTSDDDKPAWPAGNPWLLLADRRLRWQFRQDLDDWKEFAADLRDHPDFEKEFPGLSEATRQKLADAIEAALAAVDADDVDGTA